MAGNRETTVETMRALEGQHVRMTHIQFHSNGSGYGCEKTFNSKVLPLVNDVKSYPNNTVDVGQVIQQGRRKGIRRQDFIDQVPQ